MPAMQAKNLESQTVHNTSTDLYPRAFIVQLFRVGSGDWPHIMLHLSLAIFCKSSYSRSVPVFIQISAAVQINYKVIQVLHLCVLGQRLFKINACVSVHCKNSAEAAW